MTFSTQRGCFEVFFIVVGIWTLFAVAGCQVENNNKTDCRRSSCEAACAEKGFESGACEENRCVCEPADGDIYSFSDADSDTNSDTDTDTDTGPDAGNFSPDSGASNAGIQNL
jgi:hypothetical protein